MKTINAMRAVYGVGTSTWSIVLDLGDEEKRFPLAGPDHVETFIEAFDEASEALYDPETDEVVFSYEYASLDFDDEDEDEEEDEQDDDEEEDADDEDASDGKKDKVK